MKRCPACGTVYSVAQGFCPMDGAPLAEGAAPAGSAAAPVTATPSAGPAAPANAATSSTSGATSSATWDPPRASASTSDGFVLPHLSRAVSASSGPGASGSGFVVPAAAGGPGMTAGGFVVPPQVRPGGGNVAVAAAPDPAGGGAAFVPSPGTLRGGIGPARTVVAMVPQPARSAGVGALSAMEAAPATVRSNMSSGPAGPNGASGLAQVAASAAVPSSPMPAASGSGPVEVGGAFFPAGGVARPRAESAAPGTWEQSLIGRVLDQRYRIEGCIGAGGMGVVYKATHVIIEKPLAIKMLRAEVASQPDVVKRFLLEAQLASRVKHPNVVDISDYGQVAGQTAYYVMEYLEGETLAHRIDTTGRVDPALAIDLAVQTAEALQAAHANKIIHRDLKAENIFLCKRPDGGIQAKILDFGIARIRDKKTRLTAMGALIGTPAYMSPEQAQGAEVDERSDLYALGIILFEMLSGRVPFKAPTVAMVLSAQIFDAVPSLHEIEAGVPDLPNIEHVIHRLLAKNRDERPRDAAEVIHLLKTASDIDLSGPPPLAFGANNSSAANKRRPTVTIGSWSVAENPSGLHRSDQGPAVAGEARTTPRELDAMSPRSVSASGRIQRRPSVIVPSGTHVERIAAPPARPITGELENRHYPTGVNPTVPPAGPPMILIIAAAASIGAAITVTLYKVWRRNQAPVAVQAPESIVAPPVAMNRLTFESDPPGAAVFTEGGERWGVTPFTRELPATSQSTKVVFKLAGHDDLVLDVSAGESVRHKVLLRPRLADPATTAVVAPAPDGVTTAGELGAATVGGIQDAADDVPRPATPGKPRPTKPRPDAASKPDAGTPGAKPAPPPEPEPESLDMGELKNPFRKSGP